MWLENICMNIIGFLFARNFFGYVRCETSGRCGVLYSCIGEEIVEDAELDRNIFFSLFLFLLCIIPHYFVVCFLIRVFVSDRLP